MLTGCSSVGDRVGGADRCMSYAYGACLLKVEDGLVVAGDTLDMHGKDEAYVNADPRESALRHAFSDARDYGTIIGKSKVDPRARPLLY